VSDLLDLKKPESVARLRHLLRTGLNHIIGYAGMVHRQAVDQAASAEAALMVEALAAARRIEEMVQEALPPASHVADEALPRLRAAMQGYIGRINYFLERFEEIAGSSCAVEIGKIRAAARDLAEFARGADADSRVLVTPPPEPITEANGPRALPEAPQPPRPQRPAGRILVVDNDADNREILQRCLEREGFAVASEPDGRAALQRLGRERFDLVLLDIFMPDLDGYQVLAAVKANPALREIPVIVLAAADDRQHIVRSIEMGADDFLSKPFDPVVLRARIGAVLRRRQAEAECAGLAQRLESLLESSGEGILGVGRDGICTFVNRAAVEMLGYPREALLGRSLHDVIHHTRPDGSPYPIAECPIYAALQTGEPRRGREECYIRADGTSFPIEFSAHPMRRGGKADGVVVSFTGISKRG